MESHSFSAPSPENLKSPEKIGFVTKILTAGAFSFLAATSVQADGQKSIDVPTDDIQKQEQVQQRIRIPENFKGSSIEVIKGKLFVIMPDASDFLKKEGGTFKNGVITIWDETFDVPDIKNGSINTGTFISTTSSLDKNNPNQGIVILVLSKTSDEANPGRTKSITTVHNIYKKDGVIHIEVSCY